ncbi:MAG: alpha/beta fold hydrolase [Pseudonocardia sp.]
MPHLEVNGTTLYYEDEGGGRPLLWLHGWASSSQVWGAQLPEFVRDHRVVTVDWRGCGRSARPVRGNSVGGVIGDLVALIGSLALERPVVIGSSLGATFATELALRRPDLGRGRGRGGRARLLALHRHGSGHAAGELVRRSRAHGRGLGAALVRARGGPGARGLDRSPGPGLGDLHR